MEAIETREVGPLTVRIEYDSAPMDPREWTNLGVMVCGHRDYILGDVQVKEGAADDYGSIRNWLIAEYDALAETIMPLYLFDHSGLSMTTNAASFAVWDSAGWDWGQCGFIFATPETVKTCGTPPELIREGLVSEVETYDKYLSGAFVGYVVLDAEGELVESCWGFEDPEYAMAQGVEDAEASDQYRRWETATSMQLAGIGL